MNTRSTRRGLELYCPGRGPRRRAPGVCRRSQLVKSRTLPPPTSGVKLMLATTAERTEEAPSTRRSGGAALRSARGR